MWRKPVLHRTAHDCGLEAYTCDALWNDVAQPLRNRFSCARYHRAPRNMRYCQGISALSVNSKMRQFLHMSLLHSQARTETNQILVPRIVIFYLRISIIDSNIAERKICISLCLAQEKFEMSLLRLRWSFRVSLTAVAPDHETRFLAIGCIMQTG